MVFPNSDLPYGDAIFVLSCVPSSCSIHFQYWSCQIDPTPSLIDPTPSPNPIDPTQSLIDPTSVILVYFYRLHCSSDPIPTGTHRRGGTRDRRTTQGMIGTWVQAEGGKGGSAPSQETAADVGM